MNTQSPDPSVFVAKWLAQHNVRNVLYKPAPKVDPSKTYSEEDIVALIKQLPDASRFPLPESWYEKYGFVKPEPMTMQEVLKTSFRTMFAPAIGDVEERPPAEGGLRSIPELQVDNAPSEEPQPSEKVESDI